jgi:hypothetical protein
MRTHAVLLALAALAAGACQKAKPDCTVFERLRQGQPPPPTLSSDPGRFWSDFEACYTPAGASACERAATLLEAMPSMASPTAEQRAKYRADYVAACNELPEPIQRCLTAYGIGHQAECEPLHARERLDGVIRRRQEKPR